MEREKIEVMATVIASGLMSVGNHANEPEATAQKSINIARAIVREAEKQCPDE